MFRSGLWMVALNVTGRVLGIGRLLILARLLSPSDFGLVGIALVMISLFESFSATGTHLALIQRGDRARELFDTAWTLGLIRGGAMAGLLVVLAPAAGMFFGLPEAVGVVRGMALVPLMRGLTNIGIVEFSKELSFGRNYVLHMSGVAAELCVVVPLALWHAKAWALVGGWLALTTVGVVMSYALHPYRPRLRLDRTQATELLGYGRWVFGFVAIGCLLTNGVHAVVGRLLGVQALGLYQMAGRVASLPTTEVTDVVSGVTMAAYAKLQDSTERLRLAYLRVLTTVALAATPIAVGIGVYAEDLVRILLGRQWIDVVPIVRILALFGFFQSIGATAGPVFQGLDKPRVQTLVAFVELGLVAVLLVPLTLWLGSSGTAVAVTIGSVCGAAASLRVVTRLLEVRADRLLPILGWPLLACLPATLLRVRLLGPLDAPVGLVGIVVLSGILYVTVLVLLDRLNLYNLRAVIPPGTLVWFRWLFPE